MDFMKVFDQAVREIKREVNIKVLKVPEIEQKVLDATSDEPWGPHGSALAEIAQGTKKFTECQMIMNVLWTRLTDTGRYWRHVYKALTVIEYLVANGSERAVDDIVEHTFQISSLSGFEYVEPSGKDVGINVRKKVETIIALLNNKDKIQEVRDKAAANRNKYFGLSSTGMTYKSSAASYGSSSFHQSDHYGGLSGTRDGGFKEGYRARVRYGDETEWNHENKVGFGNDGREKSESQRGIGSESEQYNSKNTSTHYGGAKDDNYVSVPPSQNLSAPPHDVEDDFDPRGSSSTGPAAAKSNKVDLFGENLIVDLMDAPTSVPTERSPGSNPSNEVDLFADATFVSAAPHVLARANVDLFAQSAIPVPSSTTNVDLFAQSATPAPPSMTNVDLFAQSAFPGSSSSTTDFFAAPDPPSTANKTSKSEPTNPKVIDPFAAVSLNSYETSDLFGDFTSHTSPVSAERAQKSPQNGASSKQNTPTKSMSPQKKDAFQIKSGIWADSLCRGLIDLNISSPKKTSLADVGIVGDLGDGLDEKETVLPTSAFMGRAMGVGSGIGRLAFSPSAAGTGADVNFSNLSQHQFGSFK
ncbi:Epsin domain-containing protein [Cinnamomum micranthum f. kanehirae]|uniref:Epsin domain-containing protein n=1 Tax=Cinnamomum micranthum f. kanehirae TaxID=337451 RepID=A0A3S3Q2N7_9MAGN|nr:Epsin domain-containing protein [Cinnamomum micranthum f. kanehirae]